MTDIPSPGSGRDRFRAALAVLAAEFDALIAEKPAPRTLVNVDEMSLLLEGILPESPIRVLVQADPPMEAEIEGAESQFRGGEAGTLWLLLGQPKPVDRDAWLDRRPVRW